MSLFTLIDGVVDLDDLSEEMEEIQVAIVTSFKEEAAKFKNIINKPNKNGLTPLIYAAGEGKLELLPELIKLGADPLATNLRGESFLSYITDQEDMQFIMEHLEYFSSPDIGIISNEAFNRLKDIATFIKEARAQLPSSSNNNNNNLIKGKGKNPVEKRKSKNEKNFGKQLGNKKLKLAEQGENEDPNVNWLDKKGFYTANPNPDQKKVIFGAAIEENKIEVIRLILASTSRENKIAFITSNTGNEQKNSLQLAAKLKEDKDKDIYKCLCKQLIYLSNSSKELVQFYLLMMSSLQDIKNEEQRDLIKALIDSGYEAKQHIFEELDFRQALKNSLLQAQQGRAFNFKAIKEVLSQVGESVPEKLDLKTLAEALGSLEKKQCISEELCFEESSTEQEVDSFNFKDLAEVLSELAEKTEYANKRFNFEELARVLDSLDEEQCTLEHDFKASSSGLRRLSLFAVVSSSSATQNIAKSEPQSDSGKSPSV